MFAIITTTHVFAVDGERWTRSGDTVYVYPDEGDGDGDDADPVAEIEGGEFVAIFDVGSNPPDSYLRRIADRDAFAENLDREVSP